MTDDRLDWHLWNWSQWLGSGRIGHGYPSTASAGEGYSILNDDEHAYEKMAAWWAHVVDTIVSADIPIGPRAALHHVHTAAVWRLPRGNLEPLYREGRDLVRRGLDRRGVV